MRVGAVTRQHPTRNATVGTAAPGSEASGSLAAIAVSASAEFATPAAAAAVTAATAASDAFCFLAASSSEALWKRQGRGGKAKTVFHPPLPAPNSIPRVRTCVHWRWQKRGWGKAEQAEKKEEPKLLGRVGCNGEARKIEKRE